MRPLRACSSNTPVDGCGRRAGAIARERRASKTRPVRSGVRRAGFRAPMGSSARGARGTRHSPPPVGGLSRTSPTRAVRRHAPLRARDRDRTHAPLASDPPRSMPAVRCGEAVVSAQGRIPTLRRHDRGGPGARLRRDERSREMPVAVRGTGFGGRWRVRHAECEGLATRRRRSEARVRPAALDAGRSHTSAPAGSTAGTTDAKPGDPHARFTPPPQPTLRAPPTPRVQSPRWQPTARARGS
jgi:hypothetical protein